MPAATPRATSRPCSSSTTSRPACACSAASVAAIRAAGLHVLAYTVNEPARASELLDWGVDLICTDRIDSIGPQFAKSGE